MSSKIVNTSVVKAAVSAFCVCVVQVVDLIAELDCLMAMSSASQEYGYTSPKLADLRTITITQGRWALTLGDT